MIKVGSKVKAKDGFVGYVIDIRKNDLYVLVKNKEDLKNSSEMLPFKYGILTDEWCVDELEYLTEIEDNEDKTDTIVKVALIIQLVAIAVVALTIVALTIQTQIENDKKLDRLLENQFILEERIKELETGR